MGATTSRGGGQIMHTQSAKAQVWIFDIRSGHKQCIRWNQAAHLLSAWPAWRHLFTTHTTFKWKWRQFLRRHIDDTEKKPMRDTGGENSSRMNRVNHGRSLLVDTKLNRWHPTFHLISSHLWQLYYIVEAPVGWPFVFSLWWLIYGIRIARICLLRVSSTKDELEMSWFWRALKYLRYSRYTHYLTWVG